MDVPYPRENLLENLFFVLTRAKVKDVCSAFIKLLQIVPWTVVHLVFFKDKFANGFEHCPGRCYSPLWVVFTPLETP